MTGGPPTPLPDSASVRYGLTGALRIDLIGPRPGDKALQRERLPQAPSRWYLTGFLAPAGASDAQRAQDAEEEIDAPAEPMQGSERFEHAPNAVAANAPFRRRRQA